MKCREVSNVNAAVWAFKRPGKHVKKHKYLAAFFKFGGNVGDRAALRTCGYLEMYLEQVSGLQRSAQRA